MQKGILFVVPLPIGNEKDISIRVIEVLKSVDYILCEDTRETGKILKKFDIQVKKISYNAQTEHTKTQRVVEDLNSNKKIAIVSDRGTPIISDPGYELTKRLRNEGIKIVTLPGPTAIIPALVNSGLEPAPFTFIGFFKKKSDFLKQLEEIKRLNTTIVAYDSPKRLEKNLATALKIIGNREISISREISKTFEETINGRIKDVLPLISNIKGEIVIVIKNEDSKNNIDHEIEEKINFLLEEGISRQQAVKIISKLYDIKKNKLYKFVHSKE